MSGRPELALRLLVSAAIACGLLAMTLVGQLPALLVQVELVLTLATSWAAPALARRIPSVNARFGLAVLLQLGVLVIDVPNLRLELDAALAPLAALLLAATATDHTSVRHLVRGMWLGDACLLLAAGVNPDPALLIPVPAAVLASAAALVAAEEIRTRAATSAGRMDVAKVRPGRHSRTLLYWTAGPALACTVGAVLLGFALALLTGAGPYGPRGPTAADLLDFGIGPPGSDSQSRVPRATAGYTSGNLDLRARGMLSDQPLFAVPAGSPGLWRSSVLDRYDGISWQVSEAGAAGQLAGHGAVDIPPDPDDPPATGRGRTDEVRVLNQGGVFGVVIAPGPVARLGPRVTVYHRPGSQLWAAGMSTRLQGYQVTSYERPAVRDVPGASTGADVTDPRWTQLPDDLPQRVAGLAGRLTAGVPDRAAAVLRVEGYLRTGYTYRLDPSLPPRGQDAVDHFLFDDRTGFCEHFASAEVVLLRAAGIPARLATGFGGGVDELGTRTLLGSDAHAWAEVWLPGHGWVSSDPTAGARLAPTVRQRLRDVAARPAVRLVALVLVLPVVLAGLVAVLVRVGRLVARRRFRAPAARRTPPDPAIAGLLAAFVRLEVALRVGGRPREPWETLAALAARLPELDGAPAGPVAVLERALYGPARPSRGELQAAADALDLVAAQVLARDRQERREPAGAGRP